MARCPRSAGTAAMAVENSSWPQLQPSPSEETGCLLEDKSSSPVIKQSQVTTDHPADKPPFSDSLVKWWRDPGGNWVGGSVRLYCWALLLRQICRSPQQSSSGSSVSETTFPMLALMSAHSAHYVQLNQSQLRINDRCAERWHSIVGAAAVTWLAVAMPVLLVTPCVCSCISSMSPRGCGWVVVHHDAVSSVSVMHPSLAATDESQEMVYKSELLCGLVIHLP